jgi:hypothetical protein
MEDLRSRLFLNIEMQMFTFFRTELFRCSNIEHTVNINECNIGKGV